MTDEEFHAHDGKYILIQKIRSHVSWTSRIAPEVKDHWATFRLLDGVYDEIPAIEEISSLKDACFQKTSAFDSPESTPLFYCESSMFYFKKRKHQLIGNFPEGLDAYRNLPEEGVYFSANNDSYNADSLLLAAMKTAYPSKTGMIKKLSSLFK